MRGKQQHRTEAIKRGRRLTVRCVLLCLMVALCTSCGKSGEMLGDIFNPTSTGEYSTWPCRFAYNNLIHQDATLAASMSDASRGIFCIISETTHAGRKFVVFENNNGSSSEQPESEEEKMAKFILGLNNGIIVGFQTLINEPNGGFVAYDLQCPNCVRRDNNTLTPTYRLTIDSKGIATCQKCKKTYDMNNGGIVQNGEEGDTGLAKYLGRTMGPYDFVSVVTRQ